MANIVYLNGQWLAAADAKVSVFDRGFLFADGIYEVVTVYSGRPFLLHQHLQRLQRSLAEVNINAGNTNFWQEIINELLRRNQSDNALVYIQVTRGAEANRSHLPTGPITPTIFLTVNPMIVHWHQPAPAKVALTEDIRWLRCDIKSISLLGNIMLKQWAADHGAMEPMLHRNGRITEGASSNYFAVRDGILLTPPSDHLILPGITRMLVIELAQELGIEVREHAFSITDLPHLDEIFLTSSSREIQPIGQIDDIIIGNGRCGAITAQLIEAFHERKRRHIK